METHVGWQNIDGKINALVEDYCPPTSEDGDIF